MPLPTDNLRINAQRLWDSLQEMGEIGPGVRGGNNRQTLTDSDREGRLLFKRWCEEAGMAVGVDSMGNMFARREGADPSLDPVMMGSHLDTQPTGGRYDGVLGVLGALEVVRSMNDLGIRTKRPVVVVNWTNEEGTRFAPAMLASGVFAGVHTEAWAKARSDRDGRTVGEELKRIGFEGDEPVGERKLHALLELHIEQGPILEKEGKDIGVVTHGQGLKWLQVTLTGKEAHTGSTPMPMRVNAGLGAAKIVQLVDEIAWSHAPLAVGAVGHMDCFPNSRNIIQGKVVFTVDFRHPDKAVIADMVARLEAGARAVAADIGLGIEIEEVGGFDPVAFDDTLLARIRSAAERLGYSHRDIVSGAGHDACWINRVAPTAMIFCPCVDGLSHNEDEKIFPEWAAAGTDVLLHAALETAEIVE
ncbi:Zn-dependent hydrolase [Oharaeibacter diazotrophicus]|uniref:N-carbamoyl-L-amino-acid hydrolase n=1 Tax=Oharaeibacter diazotrophicus TaxID=1920512 RepID=A0A4V3CVN5_9HYPH|nr:Zn-dependent hydrolase [Oharaeibacter diazotrophicus]TDP83178.1 N-carbamoyl-L-amino-acid hydrolase [Oharaeibacter diazotrophicus]BBE72007.1 N-carbamoyl-L-amino acid hydrolase [Pleomorphomonas sp. SM30]GLS78772.1 Zn-dependent hydrolase [Oharaeibacter diazotrophicus]